MSNLFSTGGAGNVGFSGEVQQSLKFDRASTTHLSRTAVSPTLGTKATWSFWIKKSDVSEDTSSSYRTVFYAGTPNSDGFRVGFARYSGNGHSLQISQDQGSSAAYMYKLTNAFYRDVSGWYHFVISYDSTNATAADRIKIYVNGELASLRTSPNVNPPLNHIPAFQVSGKTLKIGDGFGGAYNEAIDGYLSNIHFIDGQALTPTSFGQFTNGYWEKIDYAGTYGNNGFHLTFQDDAVSEGFNTVTYRGNDATNRISGLGLSPDLVWLKNRDVASTHRLYNSLTYGGPVSAGSTTNYLASNSTIAETASASTLISFDSDGFSVHGSGNDSNDNGEGYVAWCWDAGSGSPVSNTDGSITSTVKANPDYGFSIISYTGSSNTSFGHGLSSQPEMVLIKRRDSAAQWAVYHTGLSSTSYYLNLDDTGAEASYGSAFINPGSTTITIDANSSLLNANGGTYICYAFASVAGYSKFGSYTGSGVSGNSITGLGFSPAWLMIKSSAGATNDWFIYDNTRQPTNPKDLELYANLTSAEYDSGRNVTFTNDGFDLDTVNYVNNSGVTYIYMAFADTREAAFWKDVSGQGNNWTPNNLDYRDSLPDSPANNFCTGNSLKSYNGGGGSPMVYSEGNLKLSRPSGATGWASSFGSMSVSSGKWFWEALCSQSGSADNVIGIHEANTSMFQILGYSGDPTGYSYNKAGNKLNNSTGSAYGATYTDGDVIGVALDMDAGTVAFYKNGASQGTAFTGLSGDFIAGFSSTNSSSDEGFWTVNFGQDSTFAGAKPMGAYTDDSKLGTFQYQPPAGFKSLCSANLPTPTIIDGSEYFNTVLYTGDGTASHDISGVGFSADFIWIKSRSNTYDNQLVNTVAGITKTLVSNKTDAEYTAAPRVNSVSSDGFNVFSSAQTNANNGTFVAWNWLAGTAVSNTDGSVTSQVSANVDAGFSIVSYSGVGASAGATVGHGLNQAPELILPKNRGDIGSWHGYHSALGGTKGILLNSTNAASTDAGFWNNTNPTSSVFTVGTYNVFDYNYIAYCFHSVEGFSKVGSYTGNGSTNGTFVFTGGRVQWLMIKRSDSTGNWYMWDDVRHLGNDVDNVLYADLSNAESVGSSYGVDFLSNGFKVRHSGTDINASGGTFIYLAIMESPLKVATAR